MRSVVSNSNVREKIVTRLLKMLYEFHVALRQHFRTTEFFPKCCGFHAYSDIFTGKTRIPADRAERIGIRC